MTHLLPFRRTVLLNGLRSACGGPTPHLPTMHSVRNTGSVRCTGVSWRLLISFPGTRLGTPPAPRRLRLSPQKIPQKTPTNSLSPDRFRHSEAVN